MVMRYLECLKWISMMVMLLLMPSSRCWSQSADVYGFGSRSISLGGAVTASTSDFSATYYNPAGLAQSEGFRFSLGYNYIQPELKLDGENSLLNPFRATHMGLVLPMKLGEHSRLAFGVSFSLPDNGLARAKSVSRLIPRWEMYAIRPHRTMITMGLGASINKYVRFGLGMGMQGKSEFEIDIRGTLGVSGSDSDLEQSMFGDLGTGRYLIAGTQIDVMDTLTLGMTYRSALNLSSSLDAKGNGIIDAQGNFGTVDLLLESQSVSGYVPQQLSIGANYLAFDKRLSIEVDVTWIDWSGYVSAIGDSDIKFFVTLPDTIPIDVDNVESTSAAIEPRFKDRVIPRLGVDLIAMQSSWADVHTRFGYYFEKSPVPTQSGGVSFLDTDKHAFSFGLGLWLKKLEPTLPGQLRFDLVGSLSLHPERKDYKDSPVSIVGDIRSGGYIWGVGLTTEVVFR